MNSGIADAADNSDLLLFPFDASKSWAGSEFRAITNLRLFRSVTDLNKRSIFAESSENYFR